MHMNINLKVTGVAEQVIERMIAQGYASNKTEAVRLALLDYEHHYLEKGEEKMGKDDLRDLQEAVKEYKAGKTVSLEDL
jgi:hypothetical protein